jgi:hypothetical protein
VVAATALPDMTLDEMTSRPITRETNIAMYASPRHCSTITRERAKGLTGMTSPRPVLVSVVKLRKSSSVQVRGS